MGSDARKNVQKEDSRRWWVVRIHSWRMGTAGLVRHRLCHKTVALSTKGMCRSKRQTFRVQTMNTCNCCLPHFVAKLNIMKAKTRMTAICTSVRVCRLLIHCLHCCTDLRKVHSLAIIIKYRLCLYSVTSIFCA